MVFEARTVEQVADARATEQQKDREALHAFCKKIDEDQENAKAVLGYTDFDNGTAAIKLHYFNQVSFSIVHDSIESTV